MPILRRQYRQNVEGKEALFAFLDPFGVKDMPFRLVEQLLTFDQSEVLLNLSTAGIRRLLRSDNPQREKLLDEFFGGGDWRNDISLGQEAAAQGREAVEVYRRRLEEIPGVRYTWAFGMGRQRVPDYYLVFASHHPRGLEKMKEAMKPLGQGEYEFFDAHRGQHVMFAADDAEYYADRLHAVFAGRRCKPTELNDFALTRTPFLNPKATLKVLETRGLLQVEMVGGATRRKGTFPLEKVIAVTVLVEPPDSPTADFQPDLFS